MPVFNDAENQSSVLLPEGEYPFTVLSYESGIQTGSGKTAGSPYWEMRIRWDDGEKGSSITYERLIDHESSSWKIDTFLKSAGVTLTKGQAFEFDEDIAESSGCLWIDPVGLRGWGLLGIDEYRKPGETIAKKRNKVKAFLTDRPKLPRLEMPKPATLEEVEDDIPF